MKEVREARQFDSVSGKREYNEIVYGGKTVDISNLRKSIRKYYPPKSDYNLYYGEIHGHSNLSDGMPDIDTYFKRARDDAKVDFCVLTDHDHGGVPREELWGEKWEIIQQKVREYYEEGKFVTILGYERNSYPWYTNLVLYYKNDIGEMVRSEVDGEITKAELTALLKRDDIIAVPHTTEYLDAGCDFNSIPLELMTPLIEVYSRWGACEYYGNSNPCKVETKGGFWRDALERGAKMGCVAGSDDHQSYPGMKRPISEQHPHLRYEHPGITVVLAKDLTRESIFEAISKRRCYAVMGAKIEIDFRINGYVIGSEFKEDGEPERNIYINVNAEESIKTITLVKNGENVIDFNINGTAYKMEDLIYDYRGERKTDYYYLRVELIDGRKAWTSPIWIEKV